MGWLLPGIDSGGIPMHLVKALLSAGPIKYFCETGSQGYDSFFKVKDLFEESFTIELTKPKVGEMVRFTGDSGSPCKPYSCLSGDSLDVLPKIIEQLDGSYCLFWLDAHYSGSEPNDTGYMECPLIFEIREVSKYKNSIIIIDDARLFLGFAMYPLDARSWPGISDIFDELRKGFKHHYITIVDDYILCIPYDGGFKDTIDKDWRDRYHIRYPSSEEVKRLAYKVAYNDAKKNLDYFEKWISL